MKRDYLEYLCCPECNSNFTLSNEVVENDLIKEGNLTCENNHEFKISNFIPRMAPVLEEETKKETINSFSSKWNQAQDYALKVARFQKEWYLRRYGFETENDFKEFISGFKLVMEAGCGVGKDTGFFAENTDGLVFAVDISTAIDYAYNNHKDKDNIFFVQADITKLPFKDEFFDFISCDQVIHHTPNTKQTFNHLISKTKSSGKLGIYVYKVKGPIREFSDDHLRSIGVKMTFDECYKMCEPITKLGKALSDLKAEFEVPEDIPELKIKKGKYDVQRFIYYNMLKCFWNDEFDYHTNVTINADWYHPLDAHRHTKEEVEQWCGEFKVKLLHLDNEDGAGISFIVLK